MNWLAFLDDRDGSLLHRFDEDSVTEVRGLERIQLITGRARHEQRVDFAVANGRKRILGLAKAYTEFFVFPFQFLDAGSHGQPQE